MMHRTNVPRTLAVVAVIFALSSLPPLASLVRITFRPLAECGTQLAPRSVDERLLAALLAQEDFFFFRHRGIDWRNARAALKENWRQGELTRGASTIAMQVATLCYRPGTEKKSQALPLRVWRKSAEWFDAFWMGRFENRDNVLRAYLTMAPLGEGTVGFVQAAQTFFGKTLTQLTPDEQWRLVLALRNREHLNPRQLASVDDLSPEAHAVWERGRERQRTLLERQRDQILALPYANASGSRE